MNNIYVVVGATGSYDSYHTWNARAFETEVAAKQFADHLNRVLAEYGIHAHSWGCPSPGTVEYKLAMKGAGMVKKIDPCSLIMDTTSGFYPYQVSACPLGV